MNPFATPTEEIQAAIAILQRAKELPGTVARKARAGEAIEVLGTTRFGRKLGTVVERFVEDDEIDRAIEILQKVLKGDSGRGRKRANRSFGQVIFRVAAGLLVPLLVLGVFMGVSMLGDDKAVALASLEQCRESQRALGTPVEAPRLAFPPGMDHNDNAELAKRALPVKGSGGKGRYHYLAEETGGAWDIRHGALEVDGLYLMVVPCGGTVSRSDAEGRLSTGYRGTGRARDVEGSVPVSAGAPCTVEVHPDPDFPSVTYNCRVAVTCGGQALYGATSDIGYVFCSARDGAPAMAVDELGSHGGVGSDPMIRMNLPGREVRVSDTGWSVTIDLE